MDLADSIKELKGANVELTEEQIMSILLTNQYLDTLNNFADKEGNNTIFLPANPDGVENIRTQILSALKAKVNYILNFLKIGSYFQRF